MPGLPDGVGMYYDVEPQHDERYFRAMVNEATKLRREFTQAYQTATSLGDRESKIKANEIRGLLENRKREILDRKASFPQEIQEKNHYPSRENTIYTRQKPTLRYAASDSYPSPH